MRKKRPWEHMVNKTKAKYGHKPTENILKNIKEKKIHFNEKEESEYKKSSFTGVCFHCGKK